MKKQGQKHHIDALAALLLFGVFAACVLTVLLTGADAYGRITRRDRAAYDRRTAVQYVATRLRQADTADGVWVEAFDGAECLVLRDGDYLTRVYCHQGWLMELYAEEGLDMDPAAGERIMAVDSMELTLTDRVLTVAMEVAGEREELTLALRSGEEGSL